MGDNVTLTQINADLVLTVMDYRSHATFKSAWDTFSYCAETHVRRPEGKLTVV